MSARSKNLWRGYRWRESAWTRTWAIFALGMVLGLGSVGTMAKWSQTVTAETGLFSRTSAPAASTPPTSTTATTAATQRAGVGDDPIGVGTAFARLDEVDGLPQLVFSTGGGAQVCTAELPGATRIASTSGRLDVTVDGRTHAVDTATCAIG